MGSSMGHLIQIQQSERTKRKRNKCIKDFKTVRLTTLNDDVIYKILSCAYTIHLQSKMKRDRLQLQQIRMYEGD